MVISWEFFSVKKYEIFNEIINNFKILLRPSFISVTTCNTNSSNNVNLIKFFIKKKIKVAPHIICLDIDIKKFLSIVSYYYIKNIKKLVVLKGDFKSIKYIYFSYNLINFIKKHFKKKFTIYSAMYTEVHPNSFNTFNDFKNIIMKINSGANYLITQYFYNIESYYFYVNNIRKIKKNIINIIPGIILLNSLENLVKFSNLCKSDIYFYIKKINNINMDSFKILKINFDFILNLLLKLLKFKIKKIHFYTMNNTYLVNKILEKLINNNNINYV